MNRNLTFLLLFVVLSATDAFAQIAPKQVMYTDTIITTEVVKRTEIISHIEEVIHIDTIYASNGARKIVKSPVSSETPTVFPEPEAQAVENMISESDDLEAKAIKAIPETEVIEAAPEVAERSLPKDELIAVEDGKYIWVPDSMVKDINDILGGNYKLVQNKLPVDRNEKVLFRGDTISMILRDRNLGRYNRGLFNYLYIPKGIWQLGITASYGEFSTEDLEMFDLVSDVDFHGKIFSVRPYFSYFLNNNMSVGMRLGYSYGRANIDSFNMDIDDDMNFSLHDIMYRSENYTAAFTFNQYFGMARRGRFAIFNEVELAFSGGTTDFIRPYNGELKHTHTTTMQAALNFSPGLSVFIIDPLTFNISFGVFGFSLKNEKQTVDGEELGSRFTSGANFRLNIFNINFGVAVNL